MTTFLSFATALWAKVLGPQTLAQRSTYTIGA